MQKADKKQTKSASDFWVFLPILFGGLETAPMRMRRRIVSVGLHFVPMQEILSSFSRYIRFAILFWIIAIAGCSYTSTSITLVDVDEGVVEQVVSEEGPVACKVKLRNCGSKPVRIVAAKTDCSCTTIGLPIVVNPNSTRIVTIETDARKASGVSDNLFVERELEFITDEVPVGRVGFCLRFVPHNQ
jgi:hypothetical protein